MDTEELKRHIRNAVRSIYSDSTAEFLRGCDALALVRDLALLEGISEVEVAALVEDERQRIKQDYQEE